MHAPFITYRLLHDQGILDAVNRGDITLTGIDLDEQLQPNSLDVRISKITYYNEQHLLQALGGRPLDPAVDDELLRESIIEVTEGTCTLPSKTCATITIDDCLSIREDVDGNPLYHLGIELRSGRGRLGLSTENHFGLERQDGRLTFNVRNWNPNPIALHVGDRFAQIFLYATQSDTPANGMIVTNIDEVASLAKCISGELQTQGPYVVFTAGSDFLRHRENIGVIDTRKRYSEAELFTRVSCRLPQTLQRYETGVLELAPRVKVPDDMAILLMDKIPGGVHEGFWMDAHVVSAGLIDSGYPRKDSYGTITAHPRVLMHPRQLHTGDAFAYGLLIKYDTPVRRPYGRNGLCSNYTTDGVAARS